MRRILELAGRLAVVTGFSKQGKEGPSLVPDGVVVYAIGDIHGRADLLLDLLGQIRDDMAKRRPGDRAVVLFLGDYVDRGPDSKAVLDILTGDPLPGSAVTCLLGNHDAVMRDFLSNPAAGNAWLDFGGDATLLSYGVRLTGRSPEKMAAASRDLAAAMPQAHHDFLESLEPFAVAGDYAFVHAGILPGRPLEKQTREDLLWIRDGFLSSRRKHSHVIVHGHTIVEHVVELPNRIAIDTGAYQTGLLTCLVLHQSCRRLLQT